MPRLIQLWPAGLIFAAASFAQLWFAGVLPGQTDLSDRRLTTLYCQALAAGQAHLLVSPDPRVLAAKDPFNSPAKQFLLYDASLYRGRYYMYFGIVPFAAVLVPWYWFTGQIASPAAVIAFFNLISLGAQLALILICAHRLAASRSLLTVLALAAVSLSSGTLLLLSRPDIYEIENAAAHAFLSLALLSLGFSAGRPAASLAPTAALTFAALTIGCRPNYLPAVAAIAAWGLAGPLLESRPWPHRLRRCMPIAAPAVVIALLLAGWNWIRFDQPLEFGLKYTVSQDPAERRPLMSPQNVPYNLHRYTIGAARLESYFPFISGPRESSVPRGPTQETTNQVYGSLWLYPLIPLGLLLLALNHRRLPLPLRGTAGVSVAAALGNFAFLMLIPMSSYRYPADFLGPLAIAAGLGFLLVDGRAHGWPRLALAGAGLGGALFSAAAVTCAAFSVAEKHLDFSRRRPHDFSTVARVFNRVAFEQERLAGSGPTAWRFAAQCHALPLGKSEPIFVWGEPGAQNFLFAYRMSDGFVQIGLESTGRKGVRSRPIAIPAERPLLLTLQIGRELPPDNHPLLAGLSPAEIALARTLVSLTVDGQPVVDEDYSAYPSRGVAYVGSSPDDPAFGRKFTGRLTATAVPVDPRISISRFEKERYGAIELEVSFVPMPRGVYDPVISLGCPTNGEQLLAEHDGLGGVRLWWANTNGESAAGEAFRFVRGQPVRIRIEGGALLPPEDSPLWPASISAEERHQRRSQVSVTVDGRTCLRADWHPLNLSPALQSIGEDTLLKRGGVMPKMVGPVSFARRDAWP